MGFAIVACIQSTPYPLCLEHLKQTVYKTLITAVQQS